MMLVRALVILGLFSQSLVIGARCLPGSNDPTAGPVATRCAPQACCCSGTSCCAQSNVCACASTSDQTPAPTPRPTTQLFVLVVLPTLAGVDIPEPSEANTSVVSTTPLSLSNQTHNERQARLCTWQT